MSHDRFTATIFRWSEGKGAWYFVEIPGDLARHANGPWGRIPVKATVDGATWETSVWKGKDGRTLLAIPKKIRGGKDEGDTVEVRIQLREARRAVRRSAPVDPFME